MFTITRDATSSRRLLLLLVLNTAAGVVSELVLTFIPLQYSASNEQSAT